MSYLQSLHDATERLIKITELFDSSVKADYANDPAYINDTLEDIEDYSELTPARLDKLALSIKELYPELSIKITTDRDNAHNIMLFRVGCDHVCCISTEDNSIALYASWRGNADPSAALIQYDEPLCLGYLAEDWH